MLLQIDRMLFEYPDFRPYLYEKKNVDGSQADRNKIYAAAEIVLDMIEYVWHNRDKFARTEDLQMWRSWIVGFFESSPVLVALHTRRSEWYPDLTALRRQVNKERAEPRSEL